MAGVISGSEERINDINQLRAAELQTRTLQHVAEHMFMISEDMFSTPRGGWPWDLRGNALPSHIVVPEKPATSMLAVMETPELGDDTRSALAVEVEDLLGYTALRKDVNAPSRLQRVLAELDIEAFEPETVQAYKEKMRAHFQAIVDKRADPDERGAAFWMRGRAEVNWRGIALAEYSKPVPEFVLRKCLEIKRKAPDAVFVVEELREEKKTLNPFLVVELGEDRAWIEVWDEPEFEKAL